MDISIHTFRYNYKGASRKPFKTFGCTGWTSARTSLRMRLTQKNLSSWIHRGVLVLTVASFEDKSFFQNKGIEKTRSQLSLSSWSPKHLLHLPFYKLYLYHTVWQILRYMWKQKMERIGSSWSTWFYRGWQYSPNCLWGECIDITTIALPIFLLGRNVLCREKIHDRCKRHGHANRLEIPTRITSALRGSESTLAWTELLSLISNSTAHTAQTSVYCTRWGMQRFVLSHKSMRQGKL